MGFLIQLRELIRSSPEFSERLGPQFFPSGTEMVINKADVPPRPQRGWTSFRVCFTSSDYHIWHLPPGGKAFQIWWTILSCYKGQRPWKRRWLNVKSDLLNLPEDINSPPGGFLGDRTENRTLREPGTARGLSKGGGTAEGEGRPVMLCPSAKNHRDFTGNGGNHSRNQRKMLRSAGRAHPKPLRST